MKYSFLSRKKSQGVSLTWMHDVVLRKKGLRARLSHSCDSFELEGKVMVSGGVFALRR